MLRRFKIANNATVRMGVCCEAQVCANPHLYFFWGDSIDIDPDAIVMKTTSTPAMLKDVKKTGLQGIQIKAQRETR